MRRKQKDSEAGPYLLRPHFCNMVVFELYFQNYQKNYHKNFRTSKGRKTEENEKHEKARFLLTKDNAKRCKKTKDETTQKQECSIQV